MPDDLVKKLRTCSKEERRAAAMELAQTGTDEAIRELIAMADGRRRYGLSWYDLDEQLIGVEALAETKSQIALNYLRKVYKTIDETTNTKDVLLYCGGHAPESDVWGQETYGLYTFPKARGKLAESLKYTGLKSWPDYEGYPPQPSIPNYRPQPSGKTHDVFRAAIVKLEGSLQQKVSPK